MHPIMNMELAQVHPIIAREAMEAYYHHAAVVVDIFSTLFARKTLPFTSFLQQRHIRLGLLNQPFAITVLSRYAFGVQGVRVHLDWVAVSRLGTTVIDALSVYLIT